MLTGYVPNTEISARPVTGYRSLRANQTASQSDYTPIKAAGAHRVEPAWAFRKSLCGVVTWKSIWGQESNIQGSTCLKRYYQKISDEEPQVSCPSGSGDALRKRRYRFSVRRRAIDEQLYRASLEFRCNCPSLKLKDTRIHNPDYQIRRPKF